MVLRRRKWAIVGLGTAVLVALALIYGPSATAGSKVPDGATSEQLEPSLTDADLGRLEPPGPALTNARTSALEAAVRLAAPPGSAQVVSEHNSDGRSYLSYRASNSSGLLVVVEQLDATSSDRTLAALGGEVEQLDDGTRFATLEGGDYTQSIAISASGLMVNVTGQSTVATVTATDLLEVDKGLGELEPDDDTPAEPLAAPSVRQFALDAVERLEDVSALTNSRD